jgi:hypothetical protein
MGAEVLNSKILEVLTKHAVSEIETQVLEQLAKNIAIVWTTERAAWLASSRRGTTPALKRLCQAQKKMISLVDEIAKFGPDEKLALQNTESPWMYDTLLALSKINNEIVGAYRGLKKEAEEQEKKAVPTRKGRPPKLIRGIVSYLERVFKRITNKPATRCMDVFTGQPRGDFDRFVQDMFVALDISANTDHQLRLLMKRRHSSKESFTPPNQIRPQERSRSE